MKIIPILLVLVGAHSFCSYANKSESNKCGAYVKSLQIDNSGNYRFRLVDESKTKNFMGSNDWSFTAESPNMAKVLNLAYFLKKEICVDFIYYQYAWVITSTTIK